jgi:catechol 2,3-dioxygenase-like lactoylglutathione lyase family enzyme
VSSTFGPMTQVAYVVKDLRATMDQFIRQGVGPWFHVESRVLDDFRYHGVDSPVEMACALANSGPLQLELIQQLNDTPSLFKDFIDAGHEGVQHIAYWTDDYDNAYAEALSLGYKVGMEGKFAGPPPARFCYFETDDVPGTVIELAETNEGLGAFFGMIREAAQDWDGADPVRPMGI